VTMTTHLTLSDVLALIERINNERQFVAVLEKDQLGIIGRVSSDPEARRELASNRAEIASVRRAIKELETQIDEILERPTQTRS
jgi:soluble cytochrome b562